MVKLGAGAAMVFDFVYVRADAASLDYSFEGQDEREHPLFCTTACVFAQLCCCRHRLRRLACLHSPRQC